jgi:small subunit ribosomal protein S2
MKLQADVQRPMDTAEDWQALQQARKQEQHVCKYTNSFNGKSVNSYSPVGRFRDLGSELTEESRWKPRDPLSRPLPPSELTVSALVASGAHFGHSHKLMNNNFLPYAYGERSGITIIDMDSALPMLRRAVNVTRAIATAGGTIVFVGTRPHLRRLVHKAAQRMGKNAYSVGERWLPGTLTNRVQFYGPEAAQTLQIIPDLVIILNPLANMHVIRECALSNVPTVGIIDSNVDPRIVMYPIPGNDDSVRTAELICGVLSIAAREGVELMQTSGEAEDQKPQESKRR